MELAQYDRVSDSLSQLCAPHSHFRHATRGAQSKIWPSEDLTCPRLGEPLHAAGRPLTARPASGFGRMQSRLGRLGGEVQCPEARRAGGALAVDLRTVEV